MGEAGRDQCDGHDPQRGLERRAQDAAILADMDRAVPQRVGGHRSHRGRFAAAPGGVWRWPDRAARRRSGRVGCGWQDPGCNDRRRFRGLTVAVQHWRPVFLGLDVGQAWPQSHFLHFLFTRHRALCWGTMGGELRRAGAVRWNVLHHSLDVWRRVRDGACLSGGYLRHAVRGRHPWTAADGVVDSGRTGACRGNLHYAVAAGRRGAGRAGLQHDALHPRELPGRGLHREPAGAAGG